MNQNMRRQYLLLIFLIFLMCSPQSQEQKKDVIGYYQSWQWQQAPERHDPANIPYEKLTAINYSFFYPLESGEIVGMDPVADHYVLEGKRETSTGEDVDESMIELAKRHGTNVVLSIGGWDHSNNFPVVAADYQKRANFAHWCSRHIHNYGFAGIDIDWEFPGYVRHNGTPQDRENFTFLLQTVRDSLDALGEKTGTHYLLSVSLPAAASHLTDLEVPKITAVADYLNIMIWDLFDSGGPVSNHNAALYGPAHGDSSRCVNGTFRLYHELNNVPAEKINLGVAFYGHSFTECTQIYTEHEGRDRSPFPERDGILYLQIAEKMNLFERFWDPIAKAPYLVSKSQNMLISFDDEESVARKTNYVINHGARGVVIWPLMGDYLKDGRTPLLDVIHQKISE